LRTTKILSLSFPPELLKAADRVAKKEGRTKSELFREAIRRYILEREYRELHRYGLRRARQMSLTEADVERVIREYRKKRS
jgi:CopG family transcriptional regulator/antitoxin EndoAI